MRLALLAVGLPFYAFAQISDLAISDDGQTLLFRSAFRLQTETDVLTQGKIYRYRNGQWTRLAAAQDLGLVVSPPDVFQPFITSDPDVYGWQINVGCILCQIIVGPLKSSQINGITLPQGFPRSNLRISHNARFVMADGFPIAGAKHLDRATGVITDVPNPALAFTLREIADDGTVLLQPPSAADPGQQKAPAAVSVWRPGSDLRPVYSEAYISAMAFSATGGMAALETVEHRNIPSGEHKLLVINTQTGERMTIASLAPRDFVDALNESKPKWDTNGTNLVYLTSTAVNLWNAVTRESRTLASSDEGFASAAITGDASVVWAVTQSNRLLRIDVMSGATQEVVPPLGAAQTQNGSAVPGSAYQIRGQGFTKDQHAFDGAIEFPLVDATGDSYWLQLPWEYRTGPVGTRIVALRIAGNPFESLARVPVGPPLDPQFPTVDDTQTGTLLVKAVHQDFSSLANSDNPARPGETLHIYMVGLGALDQEVATGQPGPFSPPAKPLATLTCQLNGSDIALPFVAYAAGMIGIYQVDATMPDSLPDHASGFSCRANGQLAVGIIMTASTLPQ